MDFVAVMVGGILFFYTFPFLTPLLPKIYLCRDENNETCDVYMRCHHAFYSQQFISDGFTCG